MAVNLHPMPVGEGKAAALLPSLGSRPPNRTSRNVSLPLLVEPTTIGNPQCSLVRKRVLYLPEAAMREWPFICKSIPMSLMILRSPTRTSFPLLAARRYHMPALRRLFPPVTIEASVVRVLTYREQPSRLPERKVVNMLQALQAKVKTEKQNAAFAYYNGSQRRGSGKRR